MKYEKIFEMNKISEKPDIIVYALCFCHCTKNEEIRNGKLHFLCSGSLKINGSCFPI